MEEKTIDQLFLFLNNKTPFMLLKTILVFILVSSFTFLQQSVLAQGCSDAGFCTIGNFNAIHQQAGKQIMQKNEIDILFIYGTHGKNEKFYQPQLNYRVIKNSGAFYELRLPFNIAKNTSTGISNSGVGDATITYNSHIKKIDYSVGLRVSFTSADKSDKNNMGSLPMYLQSGLGSTDILVVANYDPVKFISVSTGMQLPLFQYNKNIATLTNGAGVVTGTGYRRMPDALLKLTGHYTTGKFKFSSGILSIFHLANDYYNTSHGKYILQQSKGTTINFNVELGYAVSKKITVDLLFAEPIVTRKNIPDGLARSRILASKLTYSF